MMSYPLQQLVNAVCLDFPGDRNIKETNDRMSWYVVGNIPLTLRVPPVDYLKRNPLELDKFIEAVQSFVTYNPDRDIYNWDDLNLEDYSGVDCLTGLEKLAEILPGKTVGVDIETRRVEYEDNLLLSIGFAYNENSCIALYNIPIKGTNYMGEPLPPSVIYRIFQMLKKVLSFEDTTYVWHNGKFDCNRLKYLCNIPARVDEDTMLLHYACINEKRGTHGLKDLGQLYLQAPAWDDELDKIKKEWCREHKVKLSDFMYDQIPTSTLIPYMQRDCIATRRLYDLFNELKRPNSDFIYRMLIDASRSYGQVELSGVQIDLMYLEDLEFELDNNIAKATKTLNEVAAKIWDPMKYVKDTGAKAIPKGGFNIKSPKQLKWMLEEVLDYKVTSTDAATLDFLYSECEKGNIANPLAKDFIEAIGVLRKQNKYMDTYVQGIRNEVCGDGRIRCTYNLHGTETGRLSCSSPNMQNIPRDKKIKNIFKAKEGYKLLQLDYSQAELRVLALLSMDPFMIESYREGRDFHDAVAEKMFGPDFDKEQRVMAKTINFGIAYGRGPGSIAETFNKSMAEAKAIINDWYRPMPKVKEWIENQRRKAIRGEQCTSLLGRERHFVVTDENLNHIQNEYVNTPIQSLASDFTMLSLIDINDYLNSNNLDARIIITVHDSIVLEVKDDNELIDKIAKECIDIMATIPSKVLPDCPVPFKADAEVGYSWGALEEWVTTN